MWSVVALVGGLGSIVFLAWMAGRGHADRSEEDAAREFFDRHGRWPDDEG